MLWYLEWLIIAFPLFAAAVNGALGTRLPRRVQRAVSLGALVGALLVTLPFFAGHAMRPDTVGRSVAIPWFKVWTGQRFIKGPLALRLDALSTLLLLTVLIAELALRLSATQKQGDRVCPPVQATVQVAALALALLADNLWCFFGAWALLGRDARPCALRRRARTLSSIHLIGFFALLLAACVWSRYAISLSYTHLEALTSAASIEGTARAALSGGTLLAFVAIMAYAGQLPFQGTFYRGYHPSLIAIYLAGRLYPFLPSIPVVARALSWWAILSALFLAGAALIEPNPQRAMRLFLASATGCCLLAVVQGTLLSVFAFLPLAIWLKVSLYVASMPTDSALPKAGARPGARIARGLGLASFTSVPLLPGFAFHSSLLATTFAGSAALGVLTAATVALIGASAARTVHTYGQATNTARYPSGVAYALIAASTLIGWTNLASAPPLSVLTAQVLNRPIVQPAWGWWLLAAGLGGLGWAAGTALARQEPTWVRRVADRAAQLPDPSAMLRAGMERVSSLAIRAEARATDVGRLFVGAAERKLEQERERPDLPLNIWMLFLLLGTTLIVAFLLLRRG